MYLTRMEFKNYDVTVVTDTKEEGKEALRADAERVGLDWAMRTDIYGSFDEWYEDAAWVMPITKGKVMWP